MPIVKIDSYLLDAATTCHCNHLNLRVKKGTYTTLLTKISQIAESQIYML